MSAQGLDGDESRPRASETVAGFLATFAIFASLVAVAWHPLRLLPVAMVLALVAAAMGGRHARLAFAAAMIAAVCFFLGMTIAVVAQKPLW
ncbi:MAG: hypothetical protein V7644_133 [Actinomycetota bacterium]|jgi:hypothetical protein